MVADLASDMESELGEYGPAGELIAREFLDLTGEFDSTVEGDEVGEAFNEKILSFNPTAKHATNAIEDRLEIVRCMYPNKEVEKLRSLPWLSQNIIPARLLNSEGDSRYEGGLAFTSGYNLKSLGDIKENLPVNISDFSDANNIFLKPQLKQENEQRQGMTVTWDKK